MYLTLNSVHKFFGDTKKETLKDISLTVYLPGRAGG